MYVLLHKYILSVQIFTGNIDRHTVVTNALQSPFSARYVKILPKTWNGRPSMRVEYYTGCPIN